MTLTALSHLLMVVQRPSSRLPLSPTAARPYWRLYDLRIASVVDVVNEFERDVVIDLLDDLLSRLLSNIISSLIEASILHSHLREPR
jgi:hypothetical protein